MNIINYCNWEKHRFTRGSVIPYININGILFYAFGIDSKYGTICDFGGGIESIDIDIIDTCLRELKEESYNIFNISRDNIQTSTYFYHENNLFILNKVNGDMKYYTLLFNERCLNDNKREMSELIWLSRKQLLRLVSNSDHDAMYQITRQAILANKSFF